MDVAKLARGLALNRIAFGTGLILVPGLYARSSSPRPHPANATTISTTAEHRTSRSVPDLD